MIKPGDTKCVLNEGMPMHRRPFEKGRLIIHFSVRSFQYLLFNLLSSFPLLLITCYILFYTCFLSVKGNKSASHTHKHAENDHLLSYSNKHLPHPCMSVCTLCSYHICLCSHHITSHVMLCLASPIKYQQTNKKEVGSFTHEHKDIRLIRHRAEVSHGCFL